MRSFAFVIAAVSLTGSLLVAGCGRGGINGPGLSSIKVNITSPSSAQTVQVGSTVNITASVAHAQADAGGVVWSLSGAGSAGGVLSNATLTSVTYNAPAVVTTNTNVIVTATSVANPSISASFSITITASTTNNNALLNGQYAFLASGYNSAVVASIITDGSGNVTGGEEDIFAPVAPNNVTSDAYSTDTHIYSQIPITGGTYIVGADNRGALTYTDLSGNSFTFALALANPEGGVATEGQMSESDSNPLELTGSLELQNTEAFTLAEGVTPYAFGFPGWDASAQPIVSAGRFGTTNGNVFSGLIDQNDNGTLTSATFKGSLSSIDSNGRGTLKIVAPDALTGLLIDRTYFVYVVNNAKWFAVGTSRSGGVSYGEIRQQYGQPYCAGSLNSNAIFAGQTETTVPSPSASLGIMAFDGSSNDAYSLDQDAGGAGDVTVSGTASYNFTDGYRGRFTLSGFGVGYMYGSDKAFIVSENPDLPSQVGFATLEPQWNESFNNGSLQGTFVIGTQSMVGTPAPSVDNLAPPPVIYNSGVLTPTGSGASAVGHVAETVDANISGLLTSGVAVSDTYAVRPDGRVTTGSGDEVIYIVSPEKFYYLTIPSGTAGNPTIGVGRGGQLPPP